MYANLKITLTDGEQLAAWKVQPSEQLDTAVEVHTDEHDGTGSYAEPGKVLTIPLAKVATIAADF